MSVAEKGCRSGSSGTSTVYSLDALPKGELAAFGAEAGELYSSTDQGQSWTRVAAGLAPITRVLTLP